MQAAHDLCEEAHDVGTTSLLEVWIDEAQRRIWFLFEATRNRYQVGGSRRTRGLSAKRQDRRWLLLPALPLP